MSAMRQAVIEMVLLGVLSASLAFGVNAARREGRIEPTKDYFAKSASPATRNTSSSHGAELAAATEKPAAGDPSRSARLPVESASQARKPDTPAGQPAADVIVPKPKHLDHDYNEISREEVLTVLEDPETAQGLNLFVDARKLEEFAEGHLPGALQCFPYEIGKCIDRVMQRASGAEKVIVYCGGGDCEDSIFMCRELVSAGIPTEAIHLYAGGWKEWVAGGGPTQSGEEN